MNVTKGPFDAAVPTTRIRLRPLKQLLKEANKPDELRRWIFERAGHDLCRVYFPLPWMTFAFPGPEGYSSASPPSPSETNSDMWKERTEIKFVRIAPEDAGLFRDRGRMDVRYFPDGLFVPHDVSVDSGWLEATSFSAYLRVLNALYLAPVSETNHRDWDLQDCVTIMSNELFVEDRVGNDVRDHFDDSPRTERTPYELATGYKEAPKSNAAKAAIDAAKSSHAVTDVASEAPDTSVVEDPDPYGLKGRCDGVYALYLTARRCAMNPAFSSAAKAHERLDIARECFKHVLAEMAGAGEQENTRQKTLLKFFGNTRLKSALHLIHPEYDHHNGRSTDQRCEWPPPAGKKFLAQPDARRQSFMSDILALIIGGAEHWLNTQTTALAQDETKQLTLQTWLEDHGLTGAEELKTSFAVITWKNGCFQTPPKYDKPSTSRDPRGGERRA